MIKITFWTLLSFSVFAIELNVNKVQVSPGWDEKFNLLGDKDSLYRANLDCQSYFFKLDFFERPDILISENFITISECYNIYDNIINCHTQDKVKCLDSFDILNPSCECIEN